MRQRQPPQGVRRLRMTPTSSAQILGANALALALVGVHAVVAAASTSGSAGATASCAAFANVTRPVLTTACPSACLASRVCVFHPQAFVASACDTSQSPCVHGDVCAFECVDTNAQVESRGLYISIFDNDAAAAAVSSWDAEEQHIAINATLVGAWLGAVQLSTQVADVYIAGNEQAGYFSDFDGYNAEQAIVPRGDVVPFELPASFLADVQGRRNVRLENIKFPTPPQDASTSFSFPLLERLFLRNTLLTSLPLSRAKFSRLQFVDLSVNGIVNVTRWSIPEKLIHYNLSTNRINTIESGAIPAQLRILDLSLNPLQTIPIGTLPPTLEALYLDDTMLSEVPVDIAAMEALTTIHLHNNELQLIPDGALPTAEVKSLGLNNCSLINIPPDIGTMTKLRTLEIASNDLSGDVNFSVLPSKLQTLDLSSCQLKALPAQLKRLTKLSKLSISDNVLAARDLLSLPASIVQLSLNANALESIPVALQNLKSLLNLKLLQNPLSQLATGSLPSSLTEVYFSNASFPLVLAGTLPSSLTRISISDSLLEEAPEDVKAMQDLLSLNVTACKLRSFEFVEALALAQLDLKSNLLTRFSAQLPTLTHLDLTGNALEEFAFDVAPLLDTLLLADNKLTDVPASIMKFPKLQHLNLSGNPIRNFRPSSAQLKFLSSVASVTFDQNMFATECDSVQRILLRGYIVCDPGSTKFGGDASTDSVSVSVVVVCACLPLALVALIAVFWRRRRHQKMRRDEQTASQERRRLYQAGVSIWADELLLRHRLDDDLVESISLLGSGMFGEVWLASYMNEDVAVKTLKRADRDSLRHFIEEIKLVLTLTHPRIVSSVGVVWTKESNIALVTEFMAGGDLRSYLSENSKINNGWTQQSLQIAIDMAEGIVYLHSLDPIVIHRDLKSRNVLLDADLHAKLTDFGISRFMAVDETMTAEVGTVRWIAPEVLAGERYNESADIYSLGVILSELDTHKLPFEGATGESGTEPLTDSSITTLLLSGELKCIFTDSCPPEIQALAKRCTSFNPLDRPTAIQVAYELRKLRTLWNR